MPKEKCVEYILSRKTPAEYQLMNRICEFCTSNFSESSYFDNWSISWVNETDDWVKFGFYNTEYAMLTKLRFPELLTVEQWLGLQAGNNI